MDREIKFRAWDNLNKKWMLGYDLPNLGGFSMLGEVMMFGEYSNAMNSFRLKDLNEMKIMQYTGLKDKSGKEIYEGDILDVCNGSINGIHWKDKPYAVKYVPNKGFAMCMFCWDKDGNSIMDSTHYCEVIGNIYETPELLK